jgi:carboxyl-terminal processing protease
MKAKMGKERPRGEASLRGHLKGDAAKDGKEESGSNSYVPPEAEKDTQLQYALKLIRGEIPEPPPRPAEPPAATDTPAPDPAAKK